MRGCYIYIYIYMYIWGSIVSAKLYGDIVGYYPNNGEPMV